MVDLVMPFVRCVAPDDEAHSHIIQSCLNDMRYYVNSFETALELFKFSSAHTARHINARRKLPTTTAEAEADRAYMIIHAWGTLGARDGAMSIYHFATAMEGLKNLKPCPVLRSGVNHREMRIAKKLFEKRFPHFRHIRHAVAHAGELANTKEKGI